MTMIAPVHICCADLMQLQQVALPAACCECSKAAGSRLPVVQAWRGRLVHHRCACCVRTHHRPTSHDTTVVALCTAGACATSAACEHPGQFGYPEADNPK